MPDNPRTTSKLTVSWPQVRFAALLTVAGVLVMTLVVHEIIWLNNLHFEWLDAAFSSIENEGGPAAYLTLGAMHSVLHVLPWSLVTILVFVAVLRWTGRSADVRRN